MFRDGDVLIADIFLKNLSITVSVWTGQELRKMLDKLRTEKQGC